MYALSDRIIDPQAKSARICVLLISPAYLRGDSVCVRPVNQLVCSPAPEVYGPGCSCLLGCHELCPQIKRLREMLCNLPTKLISFFKFVRRIRPIPAHVAVGVAFVSFNAAPHRNLLHLCSSQNRGNRVIRPYLDTRLGCWYPSIRHGTAVNMPWSAMDLSRAGGPTYSWVVRKLLRGVFCTAVIFLRTEISATVVDQRHH